MKKWILSISLLSLAIISTGCVERELTINTDPAGAVVLLNDEEIGQSPVTVSFQWYGDYNIEIYKEGYETLRTHKLLEAPWYDAFPFDFFAQVLNPKKIVDQYQWEFQLEQTKQISRNELIQKAEALRQSVN